MLRHRRLRPVILVALVVIATLLGTLQALSAFPEYIAINNGEVAQLSWAVPLKLHVRTDRPGLLRVNGSLLHSQGSLISASPMDIEPLAAGEFSLETRLLGVIPFRRLTVDVLPSVAVVPGGHSIGIKLDMDGVAIVGHAPVTGQHGTIHHPARDGGLKPGDIIMSVNGQRVTGVQEVADLVSKSGRNNGNVRLEIKRGEQVEKLTLQPVYSPEQRRYLLGVWIRDSAAGVGTLTFYHPESGLYGALGHLITGPDSGQAVNVGQGQIVEAAVLGIEKGAEGRPGEKLGRFSQKPMGNVQRNTIYGIFGQLHQPLKQPLLSDLVPVAPASQVEPGPAEIITVVEGENMQRFQLEIEKILDRQPGGKNLVVRITDPRLLAASGGIVQGMSGSPILQSGRLVGAVTHVFVNDPTRGYGVLAHWMVANSGLLESLPALEPRAWPAVAA